MRTKASATSGSPTARTRRSSVVPSSGASPLSMPQARPLGMPTMRPPASRSKDARGVVRRNRSLSPGSANATPAPSTRCKGTSNRKTRTAAPYRAIWSVSRVHSARLREIDLPRADLERLEGRGGRSVAELERRRGAHDVEAGVAELGLALAQVERPRRADRAREPKRRPRDLAARIDQPDDELITRSRADGGQGHRRIAVEEAEGALVAGT